MDELVAIFYNNAGRSQELPISQLPQSVINLPGTRANGEYKIFVNDMERSAWLLFDEILDQNEDEYSIDLSIDTDWASRRWTVNVVKQVDVLLNQIGYRSPNYLPSNAKRIVPVNTMFYKLNSLVGDGKFVRFMDMNLRRHRAAIDMIYEGDLGFFDDRNLAIVHDWGVGMKAGTFHTIKNSEILLRQFNHIIGWNLELVEAAFDLELLDNTDWTEDIKSDDIDLDGARELLDEGIQDDDPLAYDTLRNIIRIAPFFPQLWRSVVRHERFNRFFEKSDGRFRDEQQYYLFDFLTHYYRSNGDYTIDFVPGVDASTLTEYPIMKQSVQYVWNSVGLSQAMFLKSFDSVFVLLRAEPELFLSDLLNYLDSDDYIYDRTPGTTLSLVSEAIILLRLPVVVTIPIFEGVRSYLEYYASQQPDEKIVFGLRTFLSTLRTYIESRG